MIGLQSKNILLPLLFTQGIAKQKNFADLRGAKDTARRAGCADFRYYDISKKEDFQWNFLQLSRIYRLFIKNKQENLKYQKREGELSFHILEIAVDFSCRFVIIDMKIRQVCSPAERQCFDLLMR